MSIVPWPREVIKTAICGTLALRCEVFMMGFHSRTRYDELHPSEQTGRVLAREMTNVMSGKFSAWVTRLS